MIHPIRLYGDPVLRRRAAVVDRFDDDLARLADDMIETMNDAHGVGLAAPQVGIGIRLFIATELAPAPDRPEVADTSSPSATTAPSATPSVDTTVEGEDGDENQEDDEEDRVIDVHVMINPEIVARSGEQFAPDGCLSVPGLWIEDMRRDAEITVRYQDLAGRWHERAANGHFAHVVQHELDHLDGILYFDRLDADDRQRFLEAHRSELADMQRRAKALLKELRASALPTW